MNNRIRVLLVALVVLSTTFVILWGSQEDNNKKNVTYADVLHTKFNTGPYPHSNERVFPSFSMYLVLDDAGEQIAHIDPFLELPFAFTVAVIPFLPSSQDTIQLLQERAIPFIIHMPMESSIESYSMNPVILSTDDQAVVIEKLSNAMKTLPHAIGLNNHMGSVASQNSAVMATILKHLESHKLFYLDSRTSPYTVIPTLANNYEMPVISRDVFLDNSVEASAITTQLERAIAIGRKKGSVIVIGHVTKPQTAKMLALLYKKVIEQGGRFDTLKRVYSDSY